MFTRDEITPLQLSQRNWRFLLPLTAIAANCLQIPPISTSTKIGVFIPPYIYVDEIVIFKNHQSHLPQSVYKHLLYLSQRKVAFLYPPSLVLVRKMRIIRLNGSIASICLQLPPHIPVKEKRHFYTPLHKIRVHMQKNPEIKRVVQISRHNLCCI